MEFRRLTKEEMKNLKPIADSHGVEIKGGSCCDGIYRFSVDPPNLVTPRLKKSFGLKLKSDVVINGI